MDTTAALIELIKAQGPDDKSRARALGVSLRTITEYKAGKLPRSVKILLDRGLLRVGDDTTKGGEG